jgi:hypothetical protein
MTMGERLEMILLTMKEQPTDNQEDNKGLADKGPDNEGSGKEGSYDDNGSDDKGSYHDNGGLYHDG